MIRQDQRTTGRSNSGRQADPTQRNYNRSAQYIPIISDILGGGGGSTSTQTTTQQNLPDWAVPDAMSTLSMGNYYTQNPDYRPSTLDRNYSGLRGYDQMGRPNSQAGQFGLNPMGYTRPMLADPSNFNNMAARLPSNFQGGLDSRGSGSQPGIGIADRVGANVLENDAQRQALLAQREGSGTMQQSPQGFRGRPGTGLKFADGWSPTGQDGSGGISTQPGGTIDYSQYGTGLKFADEMPQSGLLSTAVPTTGRSAAKSGEGRPQTDPGELAYPTAYPEPLTYSPQGTIRPDGSNSEGAGYPTGTNVSPENISAQFDAIRAEKYKKNPPKNIIGADGLEYVWSDDTQGYVPKGNHSSDDSDWSWEVPQIDLPDLNFDSLVEDTWLDNRPQSDPGELAYPTSLPETPTQSPQGNIRPDGSNSEGPGYPTGNDPPTTQTQQPFSETQGSNTNTQTNTTTTTQPTIDPRDIFNADDLTPFQAYDRQRFAAPSQNTVRGEGILAGRYGQRFGPGGTDPFAAANQAVGSAANYQSGFQGTTGGIGGQAGNYQTGLANASNPGVFQSGDYTGGLPNYANPNANQTNVNAAMGNVNAGLQANTFSNANAGLTGPQNYNQNFQNLVNQSMNPYQDQVVNQTIKDLDRARRISENDIRGQAAKAGAFGSREELLRAENNRNYLDRVAAATGQLRQQGFESAANRASQENLQRLGLTAQDLQQTRGLQSQGNLAAQGLTARDAQDVRGLQSQGALAAQGLQSQGGLAAQGLQSQGALAALNANAGLYQSALGLNAAGDRSAMGYNAGLLSDAMGLDAADLNQRRNLASTEAQFAENALRNAGALNLSGGQALGQLAQAGTADERQRIADMLAAGQAGDARNQQDLDFIFSEFNRELDYPGRQIDLRNAAISPATGSIVTTTQPRYQQNPILGGAGAALAAYGMTKNPWIAGGAGLLSLLS